MRRFIIQCLFFFSCFFLYDKLFIYFILKSPEKEYDKRLEYIIKGEMDKELIVLGSSKGAMDIIAGDIEKTTGLAAYNLSYRGSDIEFQAFLLKSLVKYNKPPKYLLLVSDETSEFRPDNTIGFRFDRLQPLVMHNYILDELIERKEKIKILAYPFMLLRINRSNFDLRQKEVASGDVILKCGSMPIAESKINHKFKYVQAGYKYEKDNEKPSKLKAFEEIIYLCKIHNIQLIIVTPPNYRTPNFSFIDRLKEITDEKQLIFHYDTSVTAYKDTSIYFDEAHLNLKGAQIFSKELGNYIQQLNE